ncbi:hypothetical protein EG329_006955 [Mollisiaceae sp. DMI_Dod_QoI]|nr:hypothetical protein EG329_006955 [Helotiales sp. DMI_Dod_QoI]
MGSGQSNGQHADIADIAQVPKPFRHRKSHLPAPDHEESHKHDYAVQPPTKGESTSQDASKDHTRAEPAIGGPAIGEPAIGEQAIDHIDKHHAEKALKHGNDAEENSLESAADPVRARNNASDPMFSSPSQGITSRSERHQLHKESATAEDKGHDVGPAAESDSPLLENEDQDLLSPSQRHFLDRVSQQILDNRAVFDDAPNNIVELKLESYTAYIGRDWASLWNFVKKCPHPLKDYCASRSLTPSWTSDKSKSHAFISCLCRQLGQLRPRTIKDPSGRLTLVPCGENWGNDYDKTFKDSLKTRTKDTIEGRWFAISLLRYLVLVFSLSPWWKGIGPYGTTAFGHGLSEFVTFLDFFFKYTWKGEVESPETMQLILQYILKGLSSDTKVLDRPLHQVQEYKLMTALMCNEIGQWPERIESEGAMTMATTKILMQLVTGATIPYGIYQIRPNVRFDISTFQYSFVGRAGKSIKREKRRRKNQHSPQAERQPSTNKSSIPTRNDESPSRSFT